MITSEHSATSKIAKYLNRLLRPFVDRITRSETFYDEGDFMQRLFYYTYNKQRLRSTTLFCTIKISKFLYNAFT